MDENQTGPTWEPQPELRISDLETLKVIAEPLRLKLIERLVDRPLSAKQLARDLQIPQTKLYYHLGLLEEHGLVRVAGTRVVSGIIEKQYRAVAQFFSIDKHILALTSPGGAEAMSTALAAIFDSARAEIMRGLETGLIDPASDAPPERGLIMGTKGGRLSPERLAEFRRRLIELLDEFNQESPPEEGSLPFGLTIALYPISEPPPAPAAAEEDA